MQLNAPCKLCTVTLFPWHKIGNFFSTCYVAVQWPTLGYLYLLKGQPYSPYVNHYVLSILTQQLPETL